MSILKQAAAMQLTNVMRRTGLMFPEDARAIHDAFMRWLAENDRHERFAVLDTAWRIFWAGINIPVAA